MKFFGIKLACLILLSFKLKKSATVDLRNIVHSSFVGLIGKKSSCEQNQDCAIIGVGGSFVPDPKNCHNYYLCVRVDGDVIASGSPISCPKGQFFNSDTLTCEEEIQPCVNSCDGICNLTCNENVNFVAIPGNCSAYDVCLIGGGTEPESCPQDRPYFNGLDCTTDSSLCCEFCNINCAEVGVQIPDPCDCQKYYICQELGIPSESSHAICSDGDHFDPTIGNCVPGSSCKPLCTSDFCSNSQSTTPVFVYTTTPDSITTTSAEFSTTSEITTTSPGTSTTIPPTQFITTTTIKTETPLISSTSSEYCSDSMTCISTGYYSVCNYCTSNYYICSKRGEEAKVAYCPDDQVFNPNPEYPFCLDKNHCPYPGF